MYMSNVFFTEEDKKELNQYLIEQDDLLISDIQEEITRLKEKKLIYIGEDFSIHRYKYFRFSQFLSLIQTNKLFLNKVIHWDDTFEIPEFRLPFALPEKYKIRRGPKIVPYRNYYSTKEPLSYFFGSCFSKKKDSDAMWRIYTKKNDGIMIEVDLRKLENTKSGAVCDIQYANSVKEMFFKDNGVFDKNEIYQLRKCFVKRNNFSHEEETRIILIGNKEKDHILINIENINDFIKKVYIHPLSDPYFVDIVKEICKPKNLDVVKSDLYTFPKDEFFLSLSNKKGSDQKF